jgi:hypothetical protein
VQSGLPASTWRFARTSIIELTLCEGLAIGRKRLRQAAVNTRQVDLNWANMMGVAHNRIIPKSREELAAHQQEHHLYLFQYQQASIPFAIFLKDDLDNTALTKANRKTGRLKQVMPTAT